jgi:hypothetical protein
MKLPCCLSVYLPMSVHLSAFLEFEPHEMCAAFVNTSALMFRFPMRSVSYQIKRAINFTRI